MIAAALAKSLGGKPRKISRKRETESVDSHRASATNPHIPMTDHVKKYGRLATHSANLGQKIRDIVPLLLESGFNPIGCWRGESGFGKTFKHANGEHVRVNYYNKIMTWSKKVIK